MPDIPITMSLPALASFYASGVALGALIGLAIGARNIRRERRERQTHHLATLEELHQRMGIE